MLVMVVVAVSIGDHHVCIIFLTLSLSFFSLMIVFLPGTIVVVIVVTNSCLPLSDKKITDKSQVNIYGR